MTREMKQRDRARWWLAALAPVGLAGIAAVPAISWLRIEEPKKLDAPTVRLTTAEPADGFDVDLRFVGRVEPARNSVLGFELGGLVTAVLVEEGDVVSRGRPLAELDRERLLARERELQAAEEEARVRFELAQSTLQRNSRVLESGAISKQQYDEAVQQKDAARLVLRRVSAQLAAVQVDLAKAVLTAPYDGVVARRHVDEGTFVQPGTPVIQVLETGRLEVRAGLSRQAAGRFRVGDPVRLATAGGAVVDARVLRILPQRDEITRTVDVIIGWDAPGLPPPRAQVGVDDLVDVLAPVRHEQSGFWLPRTALTAGARGLWACFAAVPEAMADAASPLWRLERRPLEVLHAEPDRVFVRGALQANQPVVADGLHRLAPGLYVKAVEPVPLPRSTGVARS